MATTLIHFAFNLLVKIAAPDNTLLYCGDLIPTSHHIRLAWLMGYDLFPLTLMEEKKQVLTQAAQENWYLFFEHDPDCDLARIAIQGDDYQVTDRFLLTHIPQA